MNSSPYIVPSSIRYTLDRNLNDEPMIYYFSKPDIDSYYILVLCEGSSSIDDIDSVLGSRYFYEDRVKSLNVGYLTLEQWGIDGNQMNEKVYWEHYTYSLRLNDHIAVLQYLIKNPPTNWNGKFIFIGVSEGGELVTDLSILFHNTIATINFVGAGDIPWKEVTWDYLEVPRSRDEYDKITQEIIDNPTPNLWFESMTYLYQADAFKKLPYDYDKIKVPLLVVKGTDEYDIKSCDLFVEKAIKASVPITYYRIDDMTHNIRNYPEIIDRSFDWVRTFI